MNFRRRRKLEMYRCLRLSETSEDIRLLPQPALMGTDTLVGSAVYNSLHQRLGSVTEIMLDMRDGRVGYAVLEFGGFFGMARSLFPVPWAALVLSKHRTHFVLNIRLADLKDAPGFQKNNWPDMSSALWQRYVHDHYGTDHATSSS